MNLRTRRDVYNLSYNVRTEEISKTAQLLSSITGVKISPNKSVIGRNAFAHESGIHQHGVMANAKTYEIMTPESVGVKKTALVLGKHSGQHAFGQRLADLGYGDLDKGTVDKLFAEFKALADRKKTMEDRDILALVEAETGRVAGENDWKLVNYVVSSSNKMFSTACGTLSRGGKETTESRSVATRSARCPSRSRTQAARIAEGGCRRTSSRVLSSRRSTPSTGCSTAPPPPSVRAPPRPSSTPTRTTTSSADERTDSRAYGRQVMERC